MATYLYKCRKCDKEHEQEHPMNIDVPLYPCPHCGAPAWSLRRLIAAVSSYVHSSWSSWRQ